MIQGARRVKVRSPRSIELLAWLGLLLAVVVMLELTLPAAREAVDGFGLVLSTGFGCLGRPGLVC